jgi:hypothetical protein
MSYSSVFKNVIITFFWIWEFDYVGINVAVKMPLASAIDASVRRQQLYRELIELRGISDRILGKLMKGIRTLV